MGKTAYIFTRLTEEEKKQFDKIVNDSQYKTASAYVRAKCLGQDNSK